MLESEKIKKKRKKGRKEENEIGRGKKNCVLCAKNGFSGAFLIPFFVMLILEGVPLFLIELGLGQRMRQGALGVWNTIHPWLGGIGIASCIVTFFVALYYNVIITWCFYYLFNSLEVSSLLVRL